MNPVSELGFFTTLVKHGSLTAAARPLDLTPPAVSKRLANMEARLGVKLLERTTRRVGLTHEGEVYLANARRILADIEEMERVVASNRAVPKGSLRVNAPLGFGRTYIAPLISTFAKRYPEVDVQLQLTDHPLNLGEEAFDIGIRFGDLSDTRMIVRKIANNRRLLCAAPAYLKKFGRPHAPAELARHQCIVLRQNDAAYGVWRLSRGQRSEAVKVRGRLSTNDGEVALNWALNGHGILMRAEWDLAKYLRSGRLELVLADYATPAADIHAVYPERHHLSAKVRAFTEFLGAHFGAGTDGRDARTAPW
ncbi:MAG: LysR substrate-binding domain-containing protein [Burkholderiaceae bacterium]